jgi:hypothetical protein
MTALHSDSAHVHIHKEKLLKEVCSRPLYAAVSSGAPDRERERQFPTDLGA